MLRRVLEVDCSKLLQHYWQSRGYHWIQQHQQTEDSADFSRATESNRMACGKWGLKAPSHTCRLTWVGGTSVLLYNKSRLENKARSNLQFFTSLSESNCQYCLHALITTLWFWWTEVWELSSSWVIFLPGDHSTSYLLLPFAGCHHPGRGNKQNETGELPSFCGWQSWWYGPTLNTRHSTVCHLDVSEQTLSRDEIVIITRATD